MSDPNTPPLEFAPALSTAASLDKGLGTIAILLGALGGANTFIYRLDILRVPYLMAANVSVLFIALGSGFLLWLCADYAIRRRFSALLASAIISAILGTAFFAKPLIEWVMLRDESQGSCLSLCLGWLFAAFAMVNAVWQFAAWSTFRQCQTRGQQ